jgi:threonine/homoserine/homoserine lactone efflux protein
MNARKKGSRETGAALLVVAIVAFIIYAYVLFGTQYSAVVVKFTVLGAVGVLLAVLGWIGYTMLTAPREGPSAAF